MANSRHPGRSKATSNSLVSPFSFSLTSFFACPWWTSNLIQKIRKLIDKIYKVQLAKTERWGRTWNVYLEVKKKTFHTISKLFLLQIECYNDINNNSLYLGRSLVSLNMLSKQRVQTCFLWSLHPLQCEMIFRIEFHFLEALQFKAC